jgi:DNA-binding winged helix-turn-helix (wHTH) protein/TolB-like protein
MTLIDSAKPWLPPVDLADEAEFVLGELRVCPARREVELGGDRQVLQPRVMQVLVALARPTSEVVSQAELISRCWGGLTVSEDSVTRCIFQLRRVAERYPEPPFEIVTVTGVGYRMKPTAGAAPAGQMARPVWFKRWRGAFAAGAIVLAVAAIVGGVHWWTRNRSAPPPATRIAVLPLEALSDRPDGKAFAEGVADQIATTLSANSIQVISSEDAAALRGADREREARRLGIALVLDGEVQDFGDVAEVRVHLDDLRRHTVLWTADVHGLRSEAAQMQAHTAKLVVNTLGCSSRALIPVHGLTDPALLARYLHACDIFVNADLTPQKVYELFDALKEVTAKAPDFAPAHSDLAKFSGYFIAMLPPPDAPGLRAQGLAEADKALALDPKSPDARLAQQFMLPPTQWAKREALLRKAVAEAPAWPHTNGFLGMLMTDVGRGRDGIPYLQRASAADLNIDWKPFTAFAQACFGQNMDGLPALRQELAVEGDNATARPFLTLALSCAGKWKEARDVVRAGYSQGAANVVSRTRFESRDAFLTAMITRDPKDRAEARRLLLQAQTNTQIGIAIPDLAALGLVDDAYALADRYEAGGPNSAAQTQALFYAFSAPMRRDPRFMALAARLKLVDYWRSSGAWPDFCAEPDLPYNCKSEAAKLH